MILSGNGLTVVYDTANNPANNSWTSYAVPLSPTGWRLNNLSGSIPTDEQFLAVLSNLSSLRIRAGTDLDCNDHTEERTHANHRV